MNRRAVCFGIVLTAATAWMFLDPPAPRGVWATLPSPPPGRTNAPGDGICTGCHGGSPLNEAGGSVTIDGVPSSYLPTQTYTITVTVQHPSQHRWGFELVPLKNSDNTMAGVLTSTTQLTATLPFNNKTYIGHNNAVPGQEGTFPGAASGVWTFTWTAPGAGAGTVTFYAAGNAANGTGFTDGDKIYTTSVMAAEGSMTSVDATTWGRIKLLYR